MFISFEGENCSRNMAFFGWRICERSFLFVCVVMCKTIDFSTRIENTVCFDSLYRYVRLYSCWNITFTPGPHITYCLVSIGLRVIHPFSLAKQSTYIYFLGPMWFHQWQITMFAGFYSFLPCVCNLRYETGWFVFTLIHKQNVWIRKYNLLFKFQ